MEKQKIKQIERENLKSTLLVIFGFLLIVSLSGNVLAKNFSVEIKDVYGEDSDGNGLYDNLITEVEINSSVNGRYFIFGEMEEIVTESIESESNYILKADENLTLKSKYNLSFSFDSNSSVIIHLDSKGPDWLSLEEGDGIGINTLDDDYDVDVTINKLNYNFSNPEFSAIEFDYTIEKKSEEVRDNFWFNLTNGSNSINFTFPWEDIYGQKIDGNLSFSSLRISNETEDVIFSEENIYNASYYYYLDFEKPADIIGVAGDYGLDENGDGLYEYLVIEFEINITRPGNYSMSFIDLFTNNGGRISLITHGRTDFDSPGIHILKAYVWGDEIYASKMNGTFNISIGNGIFLCEGGTCFSRELNPEYITSEYNYTDFYTTVSESLIFDDIGNYSYVDFNRGDDVEGDFIGDGYKFENYSVTNINFAYYSNGSDNASVIVMKFNTSSDAKNYFDDFFGQSNIVDRESSKIFYTDSGEVIVAWYSENYFIMMDETPIIWEIIDAYLEKLGSDVSIVVEAKSSSGGGSSGGESSGSSSVIENETGKILSYDIADTEGSSEMGIEDQDISEIVQDVIKEHKAESLVGFTLIVLTTLAISFRKKLKLNKKLRIFRRNGK